MSFERYVPLDVVQDLPLDADLHRWLANFDLDFYRNHQHADGVADLCGLSDGDLYAHFLRSGIREGRAYNRYFHAFLDPVFYIKRYPELRLANAWDAVRHWMYVGVYERRVPNPMTQDLLDADIHLFQMGKVGSKAIAKALFDAGHERLVPHLHWANEIVKSYPKSFFRYEEILNRDPHKKITFISGVRDPIERVISGLFQSASESKSSLGVAELVDRLNGPASELERFIAPHLQLVLDWFDHGYFRGIDVYREPFDRDRGYQIIRKGSTCVFLYRLDALDRCWEPISELVGRKIVAATANESRLKPYSAPLENGMQKVLGAAGSGLRRQVEASDYWRHFFVEEGRRSSAGSREGASRAIGSSDAPSAQTAPAACTDESTIPRRFAMAPFCGRWVRIDLTVRTSLAAPPLSSLKLQTRTHAPGGDSWRLPLIPNARGCTRLYLRVPEGCDEMVWEPANASGHFALERLSIRKRSIGRMAVEVFLCELSAGPKNFARKLWRALFAARHYGWSTLVFHLHYNLDCNVAGYGYASAPNVRDQWTPFVASAELRSQAPD